MCHNVVQCPLCDARFGSVGWRRDGQRVTFSTPADKYPKGTRPYDLPGALRKRKSKHLLTKHARDAQEKKLPRSAFLKVQASVKAGQWKATGVSQEELDDARKKRRAEQQKTYRARHKSKKRSQRIKEQVLRSSCVVFSCPARKCRIV